MKDRKRKRGEKRSKEKRERKEKEKDGGKRRTSVIKQLRKKVRK